MKRGKRRSEDALFLEAQVIGDRVNAGAPEDDPITREAEHVLDDEVRRLADELRSSWQSLSSPPKRTQRRARS